jgi:ferrochelatase
VTEQVGVLVMAHGTPASPGEVLPFYTRIRRGRPPAPEQLADLERRYDAIGGLSPLAERTAAQVTGLRRTLEARHPGRYLVTFGAKHTDPLLEQAASELLQSGVARTVGLVLTPHGSAVGSEEYVERARAVLEPGCPFVAVPPWYAHPDLIALLAGRVTSALCALGTSGERCPVIFTAHSAPERSRGTYPEQLEESARLVAGAAGGLRWLVAWQSAGRTPEPWLGPDVRDVVRRLSEEGETAFVVCPVGFVADHLEVLYDLDVELAAVAEGLGLRMARTASLNDDPAFTGVLADLVITADGEA